MFNKSNSNKNNGYHLWLLGKLTVSVKQYQVCFVWQVQLPEHWLPCARLQYQICTLLGSMGTTINNHTRKYIEKLNKNFFWRPWKEQAKHCERKRNPPSHPTWYRKTAVKFNSKWLEGHKFGITILWSSCGATWSKHDENLRKRSKFGRPPTQFACKISSCMYISYKVDKPWSEP